MKIIISHDIDHLSVKEHFGDLILPKFVGLCMIELLKKNISFGTFKKRISGLWKEKAWNNLEEVIKFDKDHSLVSVVLRRSMVWSCNQAQSMIFVAGAGWRVVRRSNRG